MKEKFWEFFFCFPGSYTESILYIQRHFYSFQSSGADPGKHFRGDVKCDITISYLNAIFSWTASVKKYKHSTEAEKWQGRLQKLVRGGSRSQFWEVCRDGYVGA